MDKTAFVEFGGIEHRNHLVRLLDHELVEKRFFEVGGGNAVFDRERVHTEEKFVTAEIAEHGNGERSDSGETAGAEIPPEENDVETLVVHELRRDIHGIGNNTEVMKTVEVFGYLKSGCAGVEHDIIAVVDQFDRLNANTLLLLKIEHALLGNSRFLIGILNGFAHGASPRTKQEVAFLEDGQILTDSDFGNTGLAADIRYTDFRLLFEKAENEGTAFFGG